MNLLLPKQAFPLLVTLRMMLTMKLLNITFSVIPKISWRLSNKNCKRCGNARWKNCNNNEILPSKDFFS